MDSKPSNLKIKINDYCDGCLYYDPDDNANTIFLKGSIIEMHTIECRHKKACERMINYKFASTGKETK